MYVDIYKSLERKWRKQFSLKEYLMKNYVFATRITAVISLFSLLISIFFHYWFQTPHTDFWGNVLLAIFGSGLVTFITSCIGYRAEKRHTLEGFSYQTRHLLQIINRYDINWNLEKKIDFFLDYSDVDTSVWDSYLGSIYFFYDPKEEKFKYIYQSIYKPIVDLNKKVSEHDTHFTLHKDGSGKNETVMTGFIEEIELLIIEKKINKHTLEDGQVIQTESIKNILVSSMLKELNGRYHDIMYGKKAIKNEE